MARTATTTFRDEKNQPSIASINLYILKFDPDDADTWRYFAERDEDVVFASKTYTKSSIKRESITSERDGSVSNTTITIPDVLGTVYAYILAARVTGTIKNMRVAIRVVWANRLDEPTSYIEDEFEAISSDKVENGVAVHLQNPIAFEDNMPRDVYSRYRCRHKVFGGDYCKYSGVVTECDRRLDTCIELDNQVNFGGQPTIKYLWGI